MPNSPASSTSERMSATRRTALAGMQATFRQRPPTCCFSMTAVFMPTWAARIAATYPPGPDPMTMQSYALSAMASQAIGTLRHLDSRHRAHQEPEQRARADQDPDAQ